jgi:hypothetical protein
MQIFPRTMALVALAGLCTFPAGARQVASEPAFAPPRALSQQDRAAVRCSAAFALASGMAAQGQPVAEYATGSRGREYLVRTGARLTSLGWTREQVAALMQAAAGEVAGELAAVLPACRTLLDSELPAPAVPTGLQCVTLLRIAAAQAQDAGEAERLANVAEQLAAHERAAMIAAGATAAEADRRMAEARDALLNAGDGDGGHDLARCLDRPGE